MTTRSRRTLVHNAFPSLEGNLASAQIHLSAQEVEAIPQPVPE
ncbi:MAG: hypothetical protein QOH19_1073 [Actinomycetota bacterium]|jgi:hypothetical protein|nr:hypothetical protein [Actinomycetota bacterium]